jgi:hypothetical protein
MTKKHFRIIWINKDLALERQPKHPKINLNSTYIYLIYSNVKIIVTCISDITSLRWRKITDEVNEHNFRRRPTKEYLVQISFIPSHGSVKDFQRFTMINQSKSYRPFLVDKKVSYPNFGSNLAQWFFRRRSKCEKVYAGWCTTIDVLKVWRVLSLHGYLNST